MGYNKKSNIVQNCLRLFIWKPTFIQIFQLLRPWIITYHCWVYHLLGASEVSANLYCNSRTSVLGRLRDYSRLLMKRSVFIIFVESNRTAVHCIVYTYLSLSVPFLAFSCSLLSKFMWLKINAFPRRLNVIYIILVNFIRFFCPKRVHTFWTYYYILSSRCHLSFEGLIN